LCFGTQGCEYDMYIVLEGEHRGKVVYTTDFNQNHPFFFTYESNFLDWYERWLDEITLGYDTSWYGYKMPGDESELIRVYKNAPTTEIKSEALDGMFKFNKMSQSSINFLKGIIEQKQNCNKAIQLICKYSFDDAKSYVLEMLKSEREDLILDALQTLHWYGKCSDVQEFIGTIIESLGRIQEPETLRFAGYVLETFNKITLRDFQPFLCHSNIKMCRTAIYATRGCSDKLDYTETILKILSSGDKEVVRDTILYWGLVPHVSLLPYYKAIWPEYRDNANISPKFFKCLKILKLPKDYFDK